MTLCFLLFSCSFAEGNAENGGADGGASFLP